MEILGTYQESIQCRQVPGMIDNLKQFHHACTTFLTKIRIDIDLTTSLKTKEIYKETIMIVLRLSERF